MPTFDPKRPIESFKALVLDMMKGYRFDVQGLYLKDGTIRPLPSEAAVVGKVDGHNIVPLCWSSRNGGEREGRGSLLGGC